MLFGKTPFTDEKGSMVVTYANIMSFKVSKTMQKKVHRESYYMYFLSNLMYLLNKLLFRHSHYTWQ